MCLFSDLKPASQRSRIVTNAFCIFSSHSSLIDDAALTVGGAMQGVVAQLFNSRRLKSEPEMSFLLVRRSRRRRRPRHSVPSWKYACRFFSSFPPSRGAVKGLISFEAPVYLSCFCALFFALSLRINLSRTHSHMKMHTDLIIPS